MGIRLRTLAYVGNARVHVSVDVGFAGKSAEQFFAILRQNNVRKILDVRLFNRSQLAGFTKRNAMPDSS